MDLHSGSWIASVFFAGNILGCLAGGAINQRLGARTTFLACAPVAAFTWAMVALAGNLPTILLSRLLSGVLFGIFQANGKVYNAEVAHPSMRGVLGTMIGTADLRYSCAVIYLDFILRQAI